MSDTAIVSEQSGETRSRGSGLHFREAKRRRRGGADEEAVCLHRCEGIGARRLAPTKRRQTSRIPASNCEGHTKDKKPAATRALSFYAGHG